MSGSTIKRKRTDDAMGRRPVWARAAAAGLATLVVGTGCSETYDASPALSADGRFIAFESEVSYLVPGDSNRAYDIFVHERQTGGTSRVSIASDGSEANGPSRLPSMSADGRSVAFTSEATNLVQADTNEAGDVFVHDRQTGGTSRVSLASDGTQANGPSALLALSISADGRFVAFDSMASNLVPNDTNGASDVFVHERATGRTSRVSLAPDGAQIMGNSAGPSISADGRFVALWTDPLGLVPPDDNNRFGAFFVHDRQTRRTESVRVAFGGPQTPREAGPPSISGDGRFVAFWTDLSGLVPDDTNGVADVFVYERRTGLTSRVSMGLDGTQANGPSTNSSISADGRYVAFQSRATNLVPGGTNKAGIFVHDRQTGRTTLASVAPNGAQLDGSNQLSISSDGRFVVFRSYSGWTDDTRGVSAYESRIELVVRDRETGQTSLARTIDPTQPNGNSFSPSISADGRFVAFESSANNLTPGDTNESRHVFVRDRQTGQTTRVSVASDGTQGNGDSAKPSISADGRFVALESSANNLTPGDTNELADIFVHDRHTGQTTWVSVASAGGQPNGSSLGASISADGRFVAFGSFASNLVPADTNRASDVFVHDRATGRTSRVNVASDGSEANGASWNSSISADGRFVAFESSANNLTPGDTNGSTDVFVHDRETGQTTRVSVASDGTQGNGDSAKPSISADGRFVGFVSGSRFVPDKSSGQADVFVHNRETGETHRVSVASDGSEANRDSSFYNQMLPLSISGDGRFVAFYSWASNLAPGDESLDSPDVYVHDWQTGETSRVGTHASHAMRSLSTVRSSISANGRFVVFDGTAPDLVPDDRNESWDVFVHDRETGLVTRVSVPSAVAMQAVALTKAPGLPSGAAMARFTQSPPRDPASGAWTPTGSMPVAFTSHTAIRLADGRVLVKGEYPHLAQIYEPSTGEWSVLDAPAESDGAEVDGAVSAPVGAAREGGAVTLLPDGRVLFIGGVHRVEGFRDAATPPAIYDPETGIWAEGSASSSRRHTASLTAVLQDGRVLVIDRQIWHNPTFYSSSGQVEIYDLARDEWSLVEPSDPPPESFFAVDSATRLLDGRVLVAGVFILPSPGRPGRQGRSLVFDPVSGAWNRAAAGPASTDLSPRATLLLDGRVLVTDEGGQAYIYDPAAGQWRTTAPMANPRRLHTATLLEDGRVLVAGGEGLGRRPLATAEIFDPTEERWAETASLNEARSGHSAVRLTDGRILVVGGEGAPGQGLASAEIFDPGGGPLAGQAAAASP